ncbi:MAG: hypothetical protein HDR88_04700 [Bacteroides sp.]|nr:hypothetical protein [Bacteroides sp.]
MSTFIIIISIILFVAAIALLPQRILIAPACAFLGMFFLSFARSSQDYPLVPVNGTILMGWLCMTIVVIVATLLQPLPVRRTSRGMGYMIVGAFVGMTVGLLGFTVSYQLNMLYGLMILSTIVGTFLGFLLYTNTPDGRAVGMATGNFFHYLLAKGFPTAITVMQIGVVLVLVIAIHQRIVG